MKGIRTIKGVLFIAFMALTLTACGGGGGKAGDGGGTGATTGTATIQGQVSGATVVAVDSDTDLEAARAVASGDPKTFRMILPTEHAYRFYLVENEGAGNTGRIYPVYMGSTNVFRMTSAANNQILDFGMVAPDFDKGTAFPANDPMRYSGMVAGGENRSIPPFLFGAGGNPFTQALYIPPVLTPTSMTSTTDSYDLALREADVEIIPGMLTRIMGFNGLTPGPTIRARVGRQVVMSHSNGLPVTTLGGAPGDVAIHLHGGHVPSSEDGFPTDTVKPGATRSYTYPNNQLPATLWYHDHLMGYTGPHVWFGMAGFYILTDDYEDSLWLPSGAYELPLVIQDRNFDSTGKLVYTGNRNGETGNTILVNGTIQPNFKVASRKYRFRVLNGSNMRKYRIALSNGQPFHVLGMEGGFLPAPVKVTSLVLASAERADIVVDFSSLPVGSSLVLQNSLGSGSTANIMRFDVDRVETDTSQIPLELRPLEKLSASQAVRTRSFTFSGGMMGMMGGVPWVINGKPFDPNRVDADPKLGTVEIWEFRNMSMMDHPAHPHQTMFQILDINGNPPPPTHAGWKDTVNVPAMGTVRIIMRFADYAGKYVLHCHVLEHEDNAMMARFDVVP
ncbi:MAG: multicopper oxidase domain-containing protein [Deltaproteobacteria bacterium]|nr:multicopper oxidase domain-containing protein [Deltaproteobacteria bacterium]